MSKSISAKGVFLSIELKRKNLVQRNMARGRLAAMWMESQDLYLSRRARQERLAALQARHPIARKAHFVLAGHFDSRVQAMKVAEKS